MLQVLPKLPLQVRPLAAAVQHQLAPAGGRWRVHGLAKDTKDRDAMWLSDRTQVVCDDV